VLFVASNLRQFAPLLQTDPHRYFRHRFLSFLASDRATVHGSWWRGVADRGSRVWGAATGISLCCLPARSCSSSTTLARSAVVLSIPLADGSIRTPMTRGRFDSSIIGGVGYLLSSVDCGFSCSAPPFAAWPAKVWVSRFSAPRVQLCCKSHFRANFCNSRFVSFVCSRIFLTLSHFVQVVPLKIQTLGLMRL
jgi:hypothetical protein